MNWLLVIVLIGTQSITVEKVEMPTKQLCDKAAAQVGQSLAKAYERYSFSICLQVKET